MNVRRHVINMASLSADGAGSKSDFGLYPTNYLNIVVGLNGALQKRFVLPNNQGLVPGNVHRATRVDVGVGGKGQDAAITLHCLLRNNESSDLQKQYNCGIDDAGNHASNTDSIRLVQFTGTGSAGDTVHQLLNGRIGEKALEFTVHSASEMRTCTSIVSANETTELVEPSGKISDEELQELYSVVSEHRQSEYGCVTKEYVRSLCIMGSMPPGCPPDTYARIYALTAGPNTVCVVDSLAGTRPLLQTVSTMRHASGAKATAGPLLFKINASELCKMAETSKSTSETAGISMFELTEAIEGFFGKYFVKSDSHDSSTGLIGLAITDGKHGAYFVSAKKNDSQGDMPSLPSFRVLKLEVPNLDDESSRTLYPIGAGDAVAAGTVAAWTSLSANVTFPSIIPDDAMISLASFVESITIASATKSLGLSAVQAQALASFTFGLACGSASCLQEENSVVDPSDVKCLFQSIISQSLKSFS
mmetsp:Transcript_11192/g.26904  ORF Transcript_11192/g.26904 Transcript_11192/m.26904 type:complete len:476 (+) Transcript_11192:41-1468(+)